ncbi:MAG: hypothetical protein EPO58_06675 [Chitinophagaceae bacterium]|nr:MAG: hypothetical protein EPO58_06675 [Chitinophagaceae bacterium]
MVYDQCGGIGWFGAQVLRKHTQFVKG